MKISEVWKSLNKESYPTNWKKYESADSDRITRSVINPHLAEMGKTKIASSTFINDAARVWNHTPQKIKDCKSKHIVKKEIRKYVKTLPI